MHRFKETLLLIVGYFLLLVSHSVAGIKKELLFTLKEGAPRGTVLGDIRDLAELGTTYRNPRFSMESLDARPGSDMFHVNSSTGILSLIGELDREAVCPTNNLAVGETCTLLRVISVDMQFWINIKIMVEDVNDSPPTFPSPTKSVDISESAPIGHLIPLDRAIDPDTARFDVRYYRLQGVDGIFDLEHSPVYLRLRLNTTLDYEKTERYNATLSACDAGVPPLCGHQQLYIIIHDVNDQTPKFEKANYSIVIEETLPVGSIVAKLTAHDSEKGLFGRITYRFARPQQVGAKYFQINSQNGEVVLRQRLQGSLRFHLMIEASDSGEISNYARTWLTVHVIDTNDHSPLIRFKETEHTKLVLGNNSIEFTTRGEAVLSLMENNQIPTDLAFVVVSDADTGANAGVTCRLDPIDNPYGKFKLENANRAPDRTILRLSTLSSFDREVLPEAFLSIICKDTGVPSLTTSVSVTISLIDRNEYPPEFKKLRYETAVEENLAAGAFVVDLATSDKDATDNVYYELDSTGSQFFNVDPHTGRIVTSQPLNCKSQQVINFLAFAVNKGVDRTLRSSTTVYVQIIDVNDHAPNILPPQTPWTVRENQDAGIKVGQLEASDADLADNAVVRFLLANTTSAGRPVQPDAFRLDPMGALWTVRHLDREHEAKYELKVIAYDQGEPRQSATATIFVFVDDENDTPPRWIFPNAIDSSLNVSTLTSPHHIITRVRAVDADSPPMNNNVTYLLNTGLDLFRLDALTGELSLIRVVPTDGRVELQLTALDNGRQRQSTGAKLTIHFIHGLEPTLGGSQRRLGLNFTLIMGLVAGSTLICMSLLMAIIVVRRRHCWTLGCWSKEEEVRQRRRSEGGHGGIEPDNSGSYCPAEHWPPVDAALIRDNEPKQINGHLQTHKLMQQTNPSLNPLAINQLIVDTEVASADSGHGASEEEVMNGLSKAFPTDPYRQQQTLLPSSTLGDPGYPMSSGYWCPPLPEEDSGIPATSTFTTWQHPHHQHPPNSSRSNDLPLQHRVYSPFAAGHLGHLQHQPDSTHNSPQTRHHQIINPASSIGGSVSSDSPGINSTSGYNPQPHHSNTLPHQLYTSNKPEQTSYLTYNPHSTTQPQISSQQPSVQFAVPTYQTTAIVSAQRQHQPTGEVSTTPRTFPRPIIKTPSSSSSSGTGTIGGHESVRTPGASGRLGQPLRVHYGLSQSQV